MVAVLVPDTIPSCSHGGGSGGGGTAGRGRGHVDAADPSVYPVASGRSGVIASYTSRALGIGTTVACPWMIVAQPGQRINLTLMSFVDAQSSSTSCSEYAVVAERSKYRDIVVCNQRASSSVSQTLNHAHSVNQRYFSSKHHFIYYFTSTGSQSL